jgi:hypothetical protein
MKNIVKLFSLFMVAIFTLVSCEEEKEWFGDYNGSGDAYVQLVDSNFDFGIFTDAAGNLVTDDTFPIGVKLLGPAQTSDVTVVIKVVSSTGANNEWSLSKTTTTIPAGEFYSEFEISIDKDATVTDSVYKVTVEIDEAASSLPAYGNYGATSVLSLKKGLSCLYDQAETVGTWNAVSGGWGVDGNVEVTADPDDATVIYVAGFETIDGLDEDQGPLKMDINPDPVRPNEYTVTVDKQVLATTTAPWGTAYDNIAYEGGGIYYSCDDVFELTFTITVDQGTFGDYDFVVTKNAKKKSIGLIDYKAIAKPLIK